MTEEESKVFDCIKTYVGKQNGVSSKYVSSVTGINERRVRDIFRDLRLTYGKLIGSSVDGGYFMCSSLEEIKECFATALSYENKNRENRQFFQDVMITTEDAQKQLGLL